MDLYRRMVNRLARIFSVVLHPLMMPVFGLLLIFSFDSSSGYLPLVWKRVVFMVVAGATLIVPLSFMPLFKLTGVIQSFLMETRKERFWPMLVTGISFGAGFWLLKQMPMVPPILEIFIWITILSLLVALSITFFWKISIHMVGMGGVSGLTLLLLFRSGSDNAWPIVFAFVSAGVVGWSRLQLEAHKPAEVYAGFALGWCMVLYGMVWL